MDHDTNNPASPLRPRVNDNREEIMRTLWLVTRIAGAPGGVRISQADYANTDWSLAALHRDLDPNTGDVTVRAVLRPNRSAADPARCATCGEVIRDDPMTGTTCACAARA